MIWLVDGSVEVAYVDRDGERRALRGDSPRRIIEALEIERLSRGEPA